MIKIIALQEGFRRCGIIHSRRGVTYDDDHWSPEQLAILKAEPMLTVQEIANEEDLSRNHRGSGSAARPNVADSIAAIKAATTLDELNKLAEGEDRKTVQPAIEARRAELQG